MNIELDWAKELNSAVTVCDTEGIVLWMNEKSKKTFAKDGGESLIGKSLFDCHSSKSTEMIKTLIITQRTNAYTIEKNGVKKLIYQTPWFENGVIKGLVEISHEIPFEMPHFVRQPS